jgi:hypothetical protein
MNDAVRFAVREVPLAVLLMPVAVAALVAFAVPYFLTAAVGKLQRHSDVTATAKVIAGSVLYPLWILGVAIVIGARLGPARGFLAVLALPMLAAAGLFAVEREAAALRTARSWFALRGASVRTRQRLRRHRAELADVLDEVNRWLSLS